MTNANAKANSLFDKKVSRLLTSFIQSGKRNNKEKIIFLKELYEYKEFFSNVELLYNRELLFQHAYSYNTLYTVLNRLNYNLVSFHCNPDRFTIVVFNKRVN